MPTVTHTYGCSYGTADVISETSTAAGDTLISIDVTVLASQTDQEQQVGFDVANIKSIFLITDGVLTIQTNDGSSPDDTFVFAANKPLVWELGMPTACPITVDVATMFLTTGSGSSVRLRGKIVFNA